MFIYASVTPALPKLRVRTQKGSPIGSEVNPAGSCGSGDLSSNRWFDSQLPLV